MKNNILAVSAILIMIIVIMGVRLPADWFFWKYLGGLSPVEMKFEWIWVWNELRLVIINGINAVLIYFLINVIETRKLRDELINQSQAGELALLKSRLNPHFLFNTLNNIYSLVYNKSDEAPEAVMKFSSIMRYVLHDAISEIVMLEKEVEYLRSYVELQKLRFKQPGLVQLNIVGKTYGIKIAPRLLIPFVENAFKHGSKNHQPAITVNLYADDRLIRFAVSNYTRKNQPLTEKHHSGMGLSTIWRRLELIYRGKYSLSVREEMINSM